MDDDVCVIEEPPAPTPPAKAKRADVSAPSARIVRSERTPILAEDDDGRPWLEWSDKTFGIVSAVGLGVAAVVIAFWILSAVWAVVLPLALIAAVLKSARPAHGH